MHFLPKKLPCGSKAVSLFLADLDLVYPKEQLYDPALLIRTKQIVMLPQTNTAFLLSNSSVCSF